MLAAGVLTALPGAAGVAHAATATINCDTASQGHTRQARDDWNTCQQLRGTAQCVWDNKDGSYTVALGYVNPTSSNLYAAIPVNGQGGENNAITATNGSASDPDHISTFWTGTSETAFTVTWSPSSRRDPVTWQLMGNTYTFYEDALPVCSTKPVPIMGNGLAIGLGLGLLLCAFVGLNRRQLARLRNAVWLRKPA